MGLLSGAGAAYEKAHKALLEILRIKHVRSNDFVYLHRRIVRRPDKSYAVHMALARF